MDIIKDGLVMIVSLFIIGLLFVFTSTPFSVVMTELMDADASSDAETQNTMSYVQTVYTIMFGILACVPVFWFVIRVFQREPDWGYNQ